MNTASTIVNAALVRQLRDSRRKLWDVYRATNAVVPGHGGKAYRDALNNFSWLVRGIMVMEQKDGSYDSAADELYQELLELDATDDYWTPTLAENLDEGQVWKPWDIRTVFDWGVSAPGGPCLDLCDHVSTVLKAFSGRPAHRHPGHAGLN